MRPKKVKELLVFAIVHKAPEFLPGGKKQALDDALMKLSAKELEILDDYIVAMRNQSAVSGAGKLSKIALEEAKADEELEKSSEEVAASQETTVKPDAKPATPSPNPSNRGTTPSRGSQSTGSRGNNRNNNKTDK